MIPILIAGPAVEPVGVTELRAYLRVDDDGEDSVLAGLAKAARLIVEASSRRILVESRWQIRLDRWPAGRVVRLPLSPLLGVERIRVTTREGASIELPHASYEVDAAGDPPRILIGPEAPDPGTERVGIAIDLRAGYGASGDAVPEPLRLAVKMLVARWFENRGDVAGAQTLPPEALALVAPFQRPRL